MQRTVWLAGLAVAVTATAVRSDPMEPDDLPDPQPEIARNEPIVVLPVVPGFELPAAEPGFHRPRELRVRGAALLGTEVRVKGHVTALYDCAAALVAANPQTTRVEVARSIRRDAALCERLWFYLGDTAGAPREASIWVVDVPRRPARLERDTVTDEEFVRWLAQPRIALGDFVVVTGQWTTRSPHNDQATGGLLVYKALEHAVPGPATATVRAEAPASSTDLPDVPAVTRPMRKLVSVPVYNESIDHLNACNRHIAAGRPDAGLAECNAALAIWNGNHLAWYAVASAHITKSEWTEARDAVEHAVALRPDQAMYQLYHGMALYEVERERADRHADESDEGSERSRRFRALVAARDALWRATRLVPELWRARYYLGRVYRDLDEPRRAAEQFSLTIAAHPKYRAGYIALTELYRSWEYLDQALAIAKLGTEQLPSEPELWYELGMAHGARRADDASLAAFDRALALRPGDARSLFQRGQIWARKGDAASARRDLEAVMASSDAASTPLKPIAQEILARLGR